MCSCLVAYVGSMTTPDIIQSRRSVKDSGVKIGGVTTSAIVARFGALRFSRLLACEDTHVDVT